MSRRKLTAAQQAKRDAKKARRADARAEARDSEAWRREVRCDGCGEVSEAKRGQVDWGQPNYAPDFVRTGRVIMGYSFYDLDGDYAHPCVCCGSWTATYARAA